MGQALGGSWTSLQGGLQDKGVTTQAPHSSPELLLPPSVPLQPHPGRTEPICNGERTFPHFLTEPVSGFPAPGPGGAELAALSGKASKSLQMFLGELFCPGLRG